MLKSTRNKGFQLTFENNLTISVQFGTENYCERKSMSRIDSTMRSNDIVESKDAEIAIWNEQGTWFDFGSDSVSGWLSANEVALWINKVSSATDINSISQD
jgi:hypothetical protein